MSLLCIHDYKKALIIISIAVIVLQIARITAISHEAPRVVHYYPQNPTLAFCIGSIFLGLLSIGLEGLLLWALREKKLRLIQPWFLTTFVIFLMASLAFAISTSLFIIRPLDHNLKVQNEVKYNGGKLKPHHIDTGNNTNNKNDTHHVLAPIEEITIHLQKVLNTFVHREENMNKNLTQNDSVLLLASLNHTEIFSEKIPLNQNVTKCSKKVLTLEMNYYSVRPLLSLSFLLDAIRSFPQLFIVNRYVKSEKLHHMHYHSHASLATLYIKQ